MRKHQNQQVILSVVIPVYNCEKTLNRLIDSILNQDYEGIEIIVVNGGSKDKSQAILEEYGNKIDVLISEPDRGIYDAMNKGIKASTGDYIFFLGGDDYFVSGGVDKFVNCISDNVVESLIAIPVFIDGVRKIMPDLSLPVPILHHQGVVFNAHILKSNELLYSDKYQIHADFDLILRYVCEFGVLFVDAPLCSFTSGGTSSNGKNCLISIKELVSIYFKYDGKFLSTKWVMFILRPIYYFLSSFFPKKGCDKGCKK